MSVSSYPFPRRGSMRTIFAAGLLVLGVFGIVPAVAVIAISLTDIRGLPGLPVNWIGFHNYVSFFSRAHFSDNLNAIVNTLEFAVFTTLFQILIALAIALLLSQRLRGRSVYRAIVFLPTVLGVTVLGLIWSLIFNPSGGPAAGVLDLFGGSSAFFGDRSISLPLVILVQVWASVGVAVVIFLAGLQSIPAELTEAAQIDGASGWKRLRLITVPMLAPSITTNVLLSIVSSLQSYQLAFVLTGVNNRATQLLSTEVYVDGFGGSPGAIVSQSQGYAASISVVQFLLVAIVSIIALGFLRRREARL